MRRNNLTATLALLLLGAMLMTVLLALVPAAGHDQLWFLLMAKRWLAGAQLYGPEAFDSNPPLVVWLSALPAWLAAHVGVAATLVAKLLVVALDAAVAWLALRALEASAGRTSRNARLWLAFAFVVVYGAVEARDFGQRDALTGLLLLPYVLLAAVWSREGSARGVARAARLAMLGMAALGVCLKPQLALVPVVVEGVLLLQSVRTHGRRTAWLRRPEPWVLMSAAIAYVAAVRAWTPLYLANALRVNLLTYWAIGHLSAPELFLQAIELHVLFAMAVAAMRWECRRQSRFAAAITVLTLAGIGATASYYAQGTGWYYQQLPAISFFGSAVALQVLGSAERWRAKRYDGGAGQFAVWVPALTAALVVLAVALTICFSGFGFTPRGFDADHTFQITQPDPAFFRGLAPGTPVAILTTSVEDAMMPVERYHLQWAQGMNNLWPLVALLRVEHPQPGDWPVPKRHQLTQPQRENLYGEITGMETYALDRWKPAMVLVARCQDAKVQCQELEGRHDDLLGFLLTSPQFAMQWKPYRFVQSIGMYDEYVR